MYTQYGHKTMSATIATSASLSTAIPILGFNQITIELPVTTPLVSTTPNVYFQICNTSTGGTFRRLAVVTGGVESACTAVDVVIPGTTGNRNYVCNFLTGYAFLKIESSVSATAAAGWGCVVHGIM